MNRSIWILFWLMAFSVYPLLAQDTQAEIQPEDPIIAGAQLATNSVKLDLFAKSWFALGDEFVEITPMGEEAKATAVLTYGKQRIELPYWIKSVEWNENFCILIGADQLTSIHRFNGKLNVEYTRKFPIKTTESVVSVRLIDDRIIGTGAYSNTAWSWEAFRETTWTVKNPLFRPWKPIAAGGRGYLFLEENGVVVAVEDEFKYLKGLAPGSRDIRFAYVIKNRLVLMKMVNSNIHILELSGQGQTIEAKEIGLFSWLWDHQAHLFPIRIGETCIFLQYGNDGIWIMEMDAEQLRYRKVQLDGSKTGLKNIFIKGKDFYSSVDIASGPVMKGDELEKATWTPLMKVEKKP